MIRIAIVAALLCARATNAEAHAVAGPRIFPATLTIDDPAVADEASLPTITNQRSGDTDGSGATTETNISAEYDKRITDHLGVAINDGYTIIQAKHAKTLDGFNDLVVTLKYQAYVNPDYEFITSVGIIREFGRTGTARTGADALGNTTPTFYFGKGLGDLPIGVLRPIAITGTIGFSVADQQLKTLIPSTSANGADSGTQSLGISPALFNNGYGNRIVGGLSVQYSIPYLQQQVRDYRLPNVLARLTPLVELAWSAGAGGRSDQPTQAVFAPGVIYVGDTFQVGLEALIPGNRASGTNIGVIGQFHLFFDDIFPNSLGKPFFPGVL